MLSRKQVPEDFPKTIKEFNDLGDNTIMNLWGFYELGGTGDKEDSVTKYTLLEQFFGIQKEE